MPRQSREISSLGMYHVMLRGINKQKIFIDNKDYLKMYKIIEKYKEELKVEIYAWCFMPNHIHLLVKADELDLLIKKIGCSYAPYFNKKYKRVGHLFQDRFKSVIIEEEIYFLSVSRYIHQNPVRAKICEIGEYQWSSYNDYFHNVGFVDTYMLKYYLKTKDEYLRFMNNFIDEGNDNSNCDEKLSKLYLTEKEDNSLSDEEAEDIIKSKLIKYNIENLDSTKLFLRKIIVQEIVEANVKPSQICKTLNVSRNKIYKCLE